MNSLGGITGGRWRNWTEGVRSGNCCYIRDESRGQLSAAALDMVAESRGHVVQGELTSTEGIAPKSGRTREWRVWECWLLSQLRMSMMTAFQPCTPTQTHPIHKCHWSPHAFLFPLFGKKGYRERYVSWLLVITLKIKDKHKRYMKGDELTQYKTTFVNFPHWAAVIHNRSTPWNHPRTSWNLLHSIKKNLIALRHVEVDVCGEGHDSCTGISPNCLMGCWIQVVSGAKHGLYFSVRPDEPRDRETHMYTRSVTLVAWSSSLYYATVSLRSICMFFISFAPFAWITIVQISWRRGINENHAEWEHHLSRIKGADGC